MKEILKVSNIKKTYQAKNGEITALNGISFTANEGDFISIIRPKSDVVNQVYYLSYLD